ncbi:hypothetical protein LBMAG48_20170 [Phycisphaerae bacterium]|nr:hypothetical protein LBMAG48_20170 [Phycisphaerae bacterium]
MELKPGYKRTDAGIIPSDWDAVPLGNIGDALIGLTYRPEDVRPHGTLVLRASNIQNDKLAFDDNVYVGVEVPEQIMVRPGDVLICVRNGSRNLIGKAALLDERCVGMTFGAFMAVHRGQDGRLVNYLFQSNILKRQINEHLGATINQITNRSLNAFCIPLPPTESERESIGTTLNDVDALLDGLDRLIAKKRDLKQATMQELLTGRNRLPGFSDEWTMKRLDQLAKIVMGQSPDSKYYNRVGDGVPLIQGNADIVGRRSVARVWTRKVSKPGQSGDILLTVRAPVGEVSIASEDCCLGRGVCALRAIGDQAFLFHALVFAEAVWRVLEQGSTFTAANSAQVAAFSVRVPRSETEQAAIAEVLSGLDAEIAALEARRDKTRLVKQAMMQELLTGRTRLVDAKGARV